MPVAIPSLPSEAMSGVQHSESDDSVASTGNASAEGASGLEPNDATDRSLLPYSDLIAPTPLRADPPVAARWFAFVSILIGGLLGALIGYGVLDLFTGSPNWSAVGALGFGVGGAVGLGVVTSLTLRAMNEWREVQHPERPTTPESSTPATHPTDPTTRDSDHR